jgi:hypothetical protein
MTTITKKKVLTQQQYGGTPDGNCAVQKYHFETDASGVYTDSDLATAVQIADVARIGVLQAGTRLDDALMIVSDVFTAAATADVGFAYVDGVDDTTVPQDADYFKAALALSAQSRTRAGNVAVVPVVLPKDAYLTLTFAGAALDAKGVLDILVYGEQVGTP